MPPLCLRDKYDFLEPVENKERYRKLNLKDADMKPDVQIRTHLTTCNNAEREEEFSKSVRKF